MIQNNPDFTDTQGTIKQQVSQFNGMADTKIYDDATRNNLTNERPATEMQNSIYNLPNNKLIFQDLGSVFAPMAGSNDTGSNDTGSNDTGSNDTGSNDTDEERRGDE